jgi:hypothetical protein
MLLPRLSKSRFCAGLQCVRQLWWRVHEPDAPELEPGPELQAVFDRGTDVGERARLEFPGGLLIDLQPWRIDDKCEATRAALVAGAQAIYEASFFANGVFTAVDVLQRLDEGFALIEVKSTYSVKPQFIPDVAIQVYVARVAGVEVRRAEVMHLRRGRYEEPDSFVRVDVTRAVEALQPALGGQVQAMRVALSGELPVIEPGIHCLAPYERPFLARCQGASRTAA